MSRRSPGGSHLLRVILVAALAGMVVLAAVLVPRGLRLLEGTQHHPVDLSEVLVFEDLPTGHVDGEVDYEVTPPPGGRHADRWLECGVYERPVRNENLVHSLEHGTVFVAYDPALGDDEVAELARLLPREGILAPYPGLRAPVVVTVWGRQLLLAGAGDPRLPLFLAAYGDGSTAPEPAASCRGGVVAHEESASTAV